MDKIFEDIWDKNVTEKKLISAMAEINETLLLSNEQKQGMFLAILGEIAVIYEDGFIKSSHNNEFNYLGNNFLGYEEIDEYRYEIPSFGLLIVVKTRYAYGSYQYCQADLFKKLL